MFLKNLTKIKQLSSIFLLHVLFIILYKIFTELVLNVEDFETSISKGIKEDLAFYIIFIVLIAPLWEEVIFRLPLRSNRWIWCSILFGMILLLGVKIWYIKLSVLLYLLAVVYFTWIQKTENVRMSLIVLSTAVFGMIHIGNYKPSDLSQMGIFEFISTFFTQIILGAILAYVRLRYSFVMSFIYHGVFNALLVSLGILAGELNT